MHAPPQRRTTVLGLELWEAGFLPLVVGAIAHFVRDGVHGAWAVIGVVAVAGYLVGTLASLVARRRSRPAGHQDWLAAILMLAGAAVLAMPDDPPGDAVWPWLVLALFVVSATAVVVREIRRRRPRRRTA